ncbi:ArsR/SmtB family transcription factor [Candidatus Omnitrophota bacterium]
MNCKKDSEFLKALGHPVRLKMVEGLMSNKCNVNEIAKKLNLPQSTVSQHLSILRTQGIIIPQKSGVKTCYKVISQKAKDILKILR